MNVFSLRARTLKGEFYVFTVLDVPVITGENVITLLGRKFSPLLQLDSVVVGTEEGLFVGDVIRDANREKYIITYNNGVRAISKRTRKLYALYELEGIRVIGQASRSERVKYRVSTPELVFRCNDTLFTLNDIIGKHRRDLIILSTPEPMRVEDVRQNTHVVINRQTIFLGDTYLGKQVTFVCGCVCIQNEFGAYDILNKQYIIRKSGGI